MNEPSVFTKIINGEIPVHKVYEDDLTYAFLDQNPLSDGHTLVISKRQSDPLWEMSDTEYIAMWQTARKVAQRAQKTLQPKRVGTIVEGFGVPHAHIHIVPLYDGNVLQLHHGYPVQTSPQAMADIAAKLCF
jgi:histidine triad (HIT) family protein